MAGAQGTGGQWEGTGSGHARNPDTMLERGGCGVLGGILGRVGKGGRDQGQTCVLEGQGS